MLILQSICQMLLRILSILIILNQLTSALQIQHVGEEYGPTFSLFVHSQEVFDYGYNVDNSTNLDDPVVVQQLVKFIYKRLTHVTSNLVRSDFAKRADFCITDPKDDWNRSFNYSKNLDFLSKCIVKTKGDLPNRLCTAADLKFYFKNFIVNKGTAATYLKPNRNCNVTAWVSGCEPGWACSAGLNQTLDFTNSQKMLPRTLDCKPCCEGFFCPQGLTCMIPCPLGSYCPLATFNATSGLCHPYLYEPTLGKQNHTCGGANIWADVSRGGAIFCSAGSYCPTNTEKRSCDSGNYCRMGSTSQTPCYKLTSCDSNTTRQNITAYGLALIALTSFFLFIFYSCSEKVIIIRERRYARSREVAAKSVKDTVQAQGRWVAAKEAVVRRAIEMQSQLSRTLSCRNMIMPTEQHFDAESGGTETETYDLYESEEGCNRSQDTNPDINHTKIEKKEKHIRTNTQIFKFAYAQLEKEKAQQQQNKLLTFSGVISMAMNNVTIRRPILEIAFSNLTVTLKEKKKHLLRSVTGEIKPGRITALMGPSGAGKTTLLSALAGKTVGCTTTGVVLINGEVESIRSYKKIVGFVPQDDIVHGNLTVEENIWFSARCRLSADLSKADKVLVVERVIDSLGLQPVRNSLVGTVEKRGISGGQRKRVNVGLELVMEPSLLFLDEPTSGLDSSSSQLLLRALRREALEGVNIVAVVHQPSYTLFNMFDDLILLAKGGLIVYHGPVSEVEEYFAYLDINVPERVNPPDYFIDVLEGMIKPSTSSSVSYEELPLRWMLHKGYHVPPDMQNKFSRLMIPDVNLSSISEGTSASFGTEQLSFWGELLQNMKYKLEAWCHVLHTNFMRSKDLSQRRTPSIFQQYIYFLGRIAKQRLREARIQAIDYLILLIAGACLGSIAKESDESFGAAGYTYTVIATSLLCKIAALRTFSLDKLQYRRERASGISSLAHFVAKDTIDHFNTLIKPLVYLSMFFFFSNPRSSFLDNYIVLLCLIYCVTGIAYALAIFLEPGPSQLCSVLLPVVLTLLSTQPKNSNFMKILSDLLYPSWALEAFIVSNAKRYYGVWLIQRCGALLTTGYNVHHWALRISLLMLAGAGCRASAFLGMLTLQKK